MISSNFIDSFKTPNPFLMNLPHGEETANEKGKYLQNMNSLINDYNNHKHYVSLLRNYNLFKWLKSYELLFGNEIHSVELVMNQFKKNYSFQCNVSLCEVKEIDIIDCVQIISVIDANLNKKKLILTKGFKENEKVDFSKKEDDIGEIIDDYFLRKGDVILCKIQGKNEMIKDYVKLNIKEIKKIS